jgi:hypothetical protein
MTAKLSLTIAASIVAAASPHAIAEADYIGARLGMFVYSEPDLPDLDQHRDTLPDLGGMHCYPTAGLNLLAFLSNNGWPELMDGAPSNWESEGVYETVTESIRLLGMYMGTTSDGTSCTNAATGLNQWIDERGASWSSDSFRFAWNSIAYRGEPTPSMLADIVSAGGLVNPGVGWYTSHGDDYIRDGGHNITMAYLSMNDFFSLPGAANDRVGWHDPSRDEDNLTAQSPFNTEYYDLGDGETAVFDDDGDFETTERTLYEVKDYAYSHVAFMDNYVALQPQIIAAFRGFDLGVPKLIAAAQVWEFEPIEFIVNEPEGLLDLALPMGNTSVVYLTHPTTSGLSKLRAASLVDSRKVELATLLNATALTVSRQQCAYVLYAAGQRVQKTELRTNPNSQSVALVTSIKGIASDDVHDRLLGVSMAPGAKIVEISLNLQSQRQAMLPVGVKPNGAIAVSPKTGNIFIASPQNSRVYEIAYAPSDNVPTIVSQINHPGLAQCVGLCVDDQEHIYISRAQGNGLEFVRAATSWVRLQPSVIDNLQFGSRVVVSVSRSNIPHGQEHNPAYRNVPPEFDQ